jgi:hypothetical protein
VNSAKEEPKIFEEVGMLPDIFDVEYYDSLPHQQSALSALLPRLRTTTLVRAVEEVKWKTEVKNCCQGSIPALKVFQTLLKDRRILCETTVFAEDFLDWPSRFAESHRCVLPTRVGMVRSSGRNTMPSSCSPHTRGDGPVIWAGGLLVIVFSHTRGDGKRKAAQPRPRGDGSPHTRGDGP